jgi:DNA-binding NarL/FixJ family response regulator
MSSQWRILIVDDHPITRYGLMHLIQPEPDLTVCGEADSAQEALEMIPRVQPHLVLADLTLPGKTGLDFIKEAQALHPRLPVLIMSMHDENVFAERVLRAGGRGYIMKCQGGQKLLAAIRCVLGGKVYLSEQMAEALLEAMTHRHPSNPAPSLGTLTDREFEVFQLIGQGFSTHEISERLNLSGKTVSTHRAHIKEKLCLHTNPELVKEAVRWAATQQLV